MKCYKFAIVIWIFYLYSGTRITSLACHVDEVKFDFSMIGANVEAPLSSIKERISLTSESLLCGQWVRFPDDRGGPISRNRVGETGALIELTIILQSESKSFFSGWKVPVLLDGPTSSAMGF